MPTPHPEANMPDVLVALHPADSEAIVAHLLRLSPDDRSMRFAAGLVTDETIRRYVAGIPFARDALFGVVDDCGVLVALAHGCVYSVQGRGRVEAAFSVDADWRRHGLATRLMAALERFAMATGAEALVAMCVVRNLPMRRIFERAGMTLSREEVELVARLTLEPCTTLAGPVLSGRSGKRIPPRDGQPAVASGLA